MRTSEKGGEVVHVHGGHIIRSTSRKNDRHSKVYTAKGPRDRRVRLAANTAIQFYDVQDRLSFDRPSKAVDWLIEKAKHAIERLPRLPPFDPDTVNYNGAGNLTISVHPPPLECPNPTEYVEFGDSSYPDRDLCLSLQSFQNGAGFEPEFGSGWGSEASNSAEMVRFSKMLALEGGGESGTLQSDFQPSIRNWNDAPVGIQRDHLEQNPQQELGIAILEPDRFMEFCVPEQISGDGDENVQLMIKNA